jgi:hypothetical protein
MLGIPRETTYCVRSANEIHLSRFSTDVSIHTLTLKGLWGMLTQRDLSRCVEDVVRKAASLFLPTTLVAVPRNTSQQIDRLYLFVL